MGDTGHQIKQQSIKLGSPILGFPIINKHVAIFNYISNTFTVVSVLKNHKLVS